MSFICLHKNAFSYLPSWGLLLLFFLVLSTLCGLDISSFLVTQGTFTEALGKFISFFAVKI